jgi:hypothetical protein
MADEPRRRRMSRNISLVLLTSLPGLAGCGGCGREEMVEVDEQTTEPAPSGPEHVIGAPFVAWWGATHPPIVVRKHVPRSMASSGGYRRGRNRVVFFPVGGRSTYMGGGYAPSGPGHSRSAPVSRGGFGSSGRGAVGG